jgi:hypothetical protein
MAPSPFSGWRSLGPQRRDVKAPTRAADEFSRSSNWIRRASRCGQRARSPEPWDRHPQTSRISVRFLSSRTLLSSPRCSTPRPHHDPMGTSWSDTISRSWGELQEVEDLAA